MAFQISLNVILGITWMLLKNSYMPVDFLKGYIMGLIIIFLFRRFFPTRFYLKPVFSFIHLLLVFIKELILSNIAVLKVVLSPKLNMKPGVFALPIELTKDWEIFLLSSMITLTPGTLVMKVSNDHKKLYVHAMHTPDVEDSINGIKNSFERLIKEVSR